MPDIQLQQKFCTYLRIFSWHNGGCIDSHTMMNGHDRRENIQAAIVLAKHGFMIELLPDLPSTEKALRSIWLPDVAENKNPDARINVRWVADFKTPAKHKEIRKATISRLIESAAIQKVEIAVLNLSRRHYTVQDIKRGIIGALQPDRNRSIRQVWIITALKNLFIMKREDAFNDAKYLELNRI